MCILAAVVHLLRFEVLTACIMVLKGIRGAHTTHVYLPLHMWQVLSVTPRLRWILHLLAQHHMHASHVETVARAALLCCSQCHWQCTSRFADLLPSHAPAWLCCLVVSLTATNVPALLPAALVLQCASTCGSRDRSRRSTGHASLHVAEGKPKCFMDLKLPCVAHIGLTGQK